MRASMSPSRGSGRKRGLRFGSGNADKGVMDSGRSTARARRAGVGDSRERGQALVEFALIAPLFLLIVVGIIQFGIGLNYWLDLNRIANQGARFAVVDHGWESCPVELGPRPADDPTLQEYLEERARLRGAHGRRLRSGSRTTPAPDVGESVTVCVLTSCFTFLPILDLGEIVLRGKATMRIEQPVPGTALTTTDCNAANP